MRGLCRRLTGCTLVLMALGIAPLAAAQSTFSFDMPAQPLAESLRTVGSETKVNILVKSDLLAGHLAPALKAQLTADQAFSALLHGTGLRHNFIDEQTVIVGEVLPEVGQATGDSGTAMRDLSNVRQHKASAQQANVAQGEGEREGMSSDARSSGTVVPMKGAGPVDEIVVTGSRLRGIGEEGPTPVVILDRQRIDQLGAASVADTLTYLPQQPFSETDNASGARAVRLRGLGYGTTLVLINGRRTVTSGLTGAFNYFDLNTVPLSAVERVEVLSDAASAIYGADAVGGVVNIITRKEIDRFTVEATYGMASGGGDERRASLSGGYSTARLKTSFVLDFFDREFLDGEHRSFYADRDFRRFGSVDQRSMFSNPGNVTSRTTANLPGLPSRQAAVPIGSTGVDLTPADFISTAGATNLESLSRFTSIVPKTERRSGLGFAEFSVTDQISLFSEFLYSERDDVRLGQPSSVTATVPAQNPFNPFGVPVTVSYLFTEIGARPIMSGGESIRAVVGARGQHSAWDWEVSTLATQDDGASMTLNNIDNARVNAALAATDPSQALNVFQDGAGGSDALLASLLRETVEDKFASEAMQAAAFARRHLSFLQTGSVELAVGGEWRQEDLRFDSRSGTPILVDKERTSAAAFVEARVPLVSSANNVRFLDRLDLTLAGRYDDYSDFGGAFTSQLGIEWRPLSRLLIRGSYGTSFRPPSLFELYQPLTVTPAGTGTFPDPKRGNEQVPVAIRRGGNPHLSPEDGDSLTVGFVLTSGRSENFRAQASYWRIGLDQRVQRLSPDVVLQNEDYLPGRIARDIPTPADSAAGLPGRMLAIDGTSVNFGALKTSGIDVEISNALTTARFGQITPALSATWVERYEAADFPDSPVDERVGKANTGGTIPKWRLVASLAWRGGPIGVSVSGRHVSPYQDATSFNQPNGRGIPPQTLFDVQSTLQLDQLFTGDNEWVNGLKARIGVANLFDEKPHFSEVSPSGFDSSQSDMRQRFGYLTVSKTF